MRKARRLFLLVSLLLIAAGLHASGTTELSEGARSALQLRDDDIRYNQVIKTDYFDIIYPPQSERTAKILAERVDSIYEQIAADFQTDAWMHLPVIISPSSQSENAYFSFSPSDRILILDTPEEKASMGYSSETLISTFYHELVHAVTAQIHKDSSLNTPFFAGDYYTLQFQLNSRLVFMEGATVSRESAGGEGRIHSGETMSMVIQAKLEDRFPSWQDVGGSRDVFPSKTASYNFGGAFSWWLQETFGMDRYADFWKECSTANLTGVSGCFREIYGISIDEAWLQFSETVPVPETESEELLSALDAGGTYSSLTYRPGTKGGIVYTAHACEVTYRYLEGDKEKSTVLFRTYGSPLQLSFSSDGRYLAVSGYMTGTQNAFSVRIWDMEQGCFTGAEIPFSRSGVITSDENGQTYLFCFEEAASYGFVSQYLLSTVLTAEDDVPEPLRRIELPVFDVVYDTVPIPGGAAGICKIDSSWLLALTDTDGTFTTWKFPEGCVPEGLSFIGTEDSPAFCTAITSRSMNAGSDSEPGALARFAVITLDEGTASLSYQQKAFSGGVHFPATDGNGNVYSISHMYEWQAVCRWKEDSSAMTKPVVMERCADPESTEKAEYASTFEAETYNQLSYMLRGSLYPLSGLQFSPLNGTLLTRTPGITWWTKNPQNTLNFQVSAGVVTDYPDLTDLKGITDLKDVTGFPVITGTEAQIKLFGNDEKITGPRFYWDITGSIFTDWDLEIKKVDVRGALLKQVPLSNAGETFNFLNSTVFIAGGPAKAEGFPRFTIGGTVVAEYAYKTKRGTNPLAYSSFSAGTQFFYEFDVTDNIIIDVKNSQLLYDSTFYAFPGVYASLRLARILPLPYLPDITVNWPLSLTASFCCSPSELFSADATVTLFSAEIQKGLPVIPFFCNRFVIDAGYYFGAKAPQGLSYTSWAAFNAKNIIKQNGYEKVQSINVGFNFVMTPDLAFFNYSQFNVGIDAQFYIENEWSDTKAVITLMGKWRF